MTEPSVPSISEYFNDLIEFVERTPGLRIDPEQLRAAFYHFEANERRPQRAADAYRRQYNEQGQWIERPSFLCH